MAQNLSLQEQISLPTAVWAQMREGHLAAVQLSTIASQLYQNKGVASPHPVHKRERACVIATKPCLINLMEHHQTEPPHRLHPSESGQTIITLNEFDFYRTELYLMQALAYPLQKQILTAKRAFLDAAGNKRVPPIPPSPLSIATKKALTAHEAWMVLATQDTVAELMKKHLAESNTWAWAVQRPHAEQLHRLPPPQNN